MKLEIFVLVLLALICVTWGWVNGMTWERDRIRKDAVQNGAAIWTSDPVTFKPKFQWKTHEQP